MLHAPKGAVFVWVNSALEYPRRLAHTLGRNDLEIVGPLWFSDHRFYGRELSGIVLDHAARLSADQWDEYARAMAYIRRPRGRTAE